MHVEAYLILHLTVVHSYFYWMHRAMLTANQIHPHAHVCGRFQNWNQLVEKKFTSKVRPLKSAGFVIDMRTYTTICAVT